MISTRLAKDRPFLVYLLVLVGGDGLVRISDLSFGIFCTGVFYE